MGSMFERRRAGIHSICWLVSKGQIGKRSALQHRRNKLYRLGRWDRPQARHGTRGKDNTRIFYDTPQSLFEGKVLRALQQLQRAATSSVRRVDLTQRSMVRRGSAAMTHSREYSNFAARGEDRFFSHHHPSRQRSRCLGIERGTP